MIVENASATEWGNSLSTLKKLQRLKSHMKLEQGKEKDFNVEKKKQSKSDVPFWTEWNKIGAEIYEFEDQFCFIVKKSYPLDHYHGHYKIEEYIHAVLRWNQSGNHHPLSAEGHNANEFFFFDTETTGLGGGTGNLIFLLGYASINQTEVIVTQHILPSPGNEVAFYKSFLESVDYEMLVTYNGKAFDWPQVKTRHTMVRDQVPKLPQFGHFDLLHGSRRLWKGKFDSVKLSRVEKEILGVERVGDVPGYLAPIIYFDFVERKDPQGLFEIMKHNELDVLSLISLYTHLTDELLGEESDRSEMESYKVGQWYLSLGDLDKAEIFFRKSLDSPHSIFKGESYYGLAMIKKKQRQFVEAYTFFEDASTLLSGIYQIKAYIELAKLAEHKMKEYQLALKHVQEASRLAYIDEQSKSLKGELSKDQLEKREIRIKGRYRSND
jgi:uncharacterized protein YprB with RNaseH-like and TPR domain